MATDRPQRAPFFLPGEIPRLLAMVGMLAVMGMFIFQARDPSMWQWLAQENAPKDAAEDAPAKTPAPAVHGAANANLSVTSPPVSRPAEASSDQLPKSPAEDPPAAATSSASPLPDSAPPAATAPQPPETLAGTDLDPEEQAEFQKDLVRISDFTTEIQGIEMKPYLRLFHWAQLQSLEALRARATKPKMFREYAQRRSAEDHRGELLALDLDVRMINVKPLTDYPEFEAMGIDRVYEIYGTTEQSKPFFWCCLASTLPKGMKTGYVSERAKFYGFFFKVHGYVPHDAKAPNKAWPAPLLIGRLDWHPPKVVAVNAEANGSEWIIGGGLAGLAIMLCVLVYFLNSYRKAHFSGSLPTPEASAAGFAQFLERGEDHFADGHIPFDPHANGHSAHGTGLPYSDQSEA